MQWEKHTKEGFGFKNDLVCEWHFHSGLELWQINWRERKPN